MSSSPRKTAAHQRPQGTFRYQPLPRNPPTIRIVHLLPDLTASGLLQCELQHATFDDDDDECPSYEALSYVWGAPDDTAELECNGSRIHITQLLDDALRKLRLPDTPRSMWIDQLAINQADDREKTSQVAMMRDIYRRAERTVVWLGAESESAQVAFAALQRVISATVSQSVSKEEGSSSQDLLDLARNFNQRFAMSNRHPDMGPWKVSSDEFGAVAQLLRQPWFTRMWTIQEAAVPKQVLVTYGDDAIDIDLFTFAVDIVRMNRLQATISNVSNIMFIAHLRTSLREEAELPLQDLLEIAVSYHATDPRDQLYALYGLTTTDLPSLHLYPDYSITVIEAYKKVTATILQSSKDLRLLELAGGDLEEESELPSWVPACSVRASQAMPITGPPSHHQKLVGKPFQDAFISQMVNQNAIDLEDVDVDVWRQTLEEALNESDDDAESQNKTEENAVVIPQYAATKSSLLREVRMDPGGILHLPGQLVDKLKEVGNVLPNPPKGTVDEELSGLGVVFDKVKEIYSLVREYAMVIAERDDMIMSKKSGVVYPTGERLETVYWKTMCANHRSFSEEETEKVFEKWRNAFRTVRLLFQAQKKINTRKIPRIGAVLALFIGRGTGFKEVDMFATRTQVSYQRKMGWTQHGYLALLPARAVQGDMIALLQGGRLPFVIRLQGGIWHIVGPCYVHGIMDGELFDESDCVDLPFA